MYVPIIPHTSIQNKTIIYCDTVLNLKDKGNNIIITSINDVKEYELEKCLNLIFENNPNILFHTIQYSRKECKIYFYTDRTINISVWENLKINTYNKTNSSTILENIKNIFTQEVNTDKNCISIYTVSLLLKKMKEEYKRIKDDYQYYLDSEMYPSHIIIYDFDYKTNELHIGVSFLDTFCNISFSKQNDDLFITKSDYYDNQKVLYTIGNDLCKLYDEFIKFKDYKIQHSYEIKTLNSLFSADVSEYGVSIRLNDFQLTSNSYSPKYRYNCNSLKTLNIIKGNEEELFKRIFVNISDLPEWCQSTLYEIRNQELEDSKIKSKTFMSKFKNFITKHF